MTKKIGMVSLGCDKNRVDSENILFSLKNAGYSIVQDSSEADVIIVNTCAFIESAKKESIDAILEQAEYKKDKKIKLVAVGCLAERYGKELSEALPEVDAFVGVNSYHDIVSIIEGDSRLVKDNVYTPYEKGRVITTPYHYAYLKIAEGCNNYCSYCAIPFIRGRYRSIPMEEILKDAESLIQNGIKEVIVVAQDITRYGFDLYGKFMLKDLLKELCKMDFYKIRLMYAYPELIDDELIRLISQEEKIAKYIDVPLQHIDDNVLKRMNRRSSGQKARKLISRIKEIDSSIAIRSSFIVGFPGETEEEFNNLASFIQEGLIDYAGFFAYSKEEGTAASKHLGQITKKVKNQRLTELSKAQSANIVANNQKYLGKVLKVIYEGIDYKKNVFYGRNQFNAPEIDTRVLFTSDFPLDIGEVYEVEITEALFDLVGKAKR